MTVYFRSNRSAIVIDFRVDVAGDYVYVLDGGLEIHTDGPKGLKSVAIAGRLYDYAEDISEGDVQCSIFTFSREIAQ